jgi:hypothetical protein
MIVYVRNVDVRIVVWLVPSSTAEVRTAVSSRFTLSVQDANSTVRHGQLMTGCSVEIREPLLDNHRCV